MMTITLSRLAESDLKSIARYTQKQWGHRQAEIYISALRQTMREIGEERVRPIRLVIGRVEFYRVLCGKHHIYMQRSSHHMFISRVLHGAMDVHLQLLPQVPKKLK